MKQRLHELLLSLYMAQLWQSSMVRSAELPVEPHDKDWFCVRETGRRLTALSPEKDTVEACWAEAVRLQYRYLAVGLRGCWVGRRVHGLTLAPCTRYSITIIHVDKYNFELAQLHPGTQFWVAATSPRGVGWSRLRNVTDQVLGLADCAALCERYFQDFCRVDQTGCRCGRSSHNVRLTIRHQDLRHTRRRRQRLQPSIIVKLRKGKLAGWLCTGAPSQFVKHTGTQTMQEALLACHRRQFLYIASGEDGFYCGNNTENLERFSMSQCEMKLTARKSYSIIDITEIEREISYIEETVTEYIFWWVSEKPSAVFWTTLVEIRSLEQCVLQCSKRFITVGADGCGCGSLREGGASLELREWVKKQPNSASLGQGYLLLDREGFTNVPEGWACSTRPPGWQHIQGQRFESCLQQCHRNKQPLLSIGSEGCFCGRSTLGLSHLAMSQCQNPQHQPGSPNSILSVDVWINNTVTISSRPGLKTLWLATKPVDVEWKALPGNSVLEGCVLSCELTKGVKYVLLGVDGCECGYAGENSDDTLDWSSMEWTTDSQLGPSRGFFLIIRDTLSEGSAILEQDWVTKRNETTRRDLNDDDDNGVWKKANTFHSSGLSGGKKYRRVEDERDQEYQEQRQEGSSRELLQGRRATSSDTETVQDRVKYQQNSTAVGDTANSHRSAHTRNSTDTAQQSQTTSSVDHHQQTYIKAEENAIIFGKSTKLHVQEEDETKDKLENEVYNRHSVTGERMSGTMEKITRGATSTRQKLTLTGTELLKKDVRANQTHLHAEVESERIRGLRQRNETVKERSEGTTNDLLYVIGGRCYRGEYSNSSWLRVSDTVPTASLCLCVCVQNMEHAFSIHFSGQCYCSKTPGTLGSESSITTTDRCPQQQDRLVYDGIKHAGDILTFCNSVRATSGNTTNNNVLFSRTNRVNSGQRTTEYSEDQRVLARRNISTLTATHMRRQEDRSKEEELKTHIITGKTQETWKSHLRKGLFARQFHLKLHLRKEHQQQERLHLNVKRKVHSRVHERRSVVRPTKLAELLPGAAGVQAKFRPGPGAASVHKLPQEQDKDEVGMKEPDVANKLQRLSDEATPERSGDSPSGYRHTGIATRVRTKFIREKLRLTGRRRPYLKNRAPAGALTVRVTQRALPVPSRPDDTRL